MKGICLIGSLPNLDVGKEQQRYARGDTREQSGAGAEGEDGGEYSGANAGGASRRQRVCGRDGAVALL
jgi:hypothetical protein